MKKILISFFIFLACTFSAKAQGGGFTGGSFTLFMSDHLMTQVTAHGGYAFNDKLAAYAGIGFAAVYDGEWGAAGSSEIGLRWTPWHGDVLYLDLKPRVSMTFTDRIDVMDVGIIPSLRFRVSPHWDFFADFGSIGARYYYGIWVPFVGVTSVHASLGVNYRF